MLSERESVSALQALAMAEGLLPTASPQHAKILRASAGMNRVEIPVDLKNILAGKKIDVALQPEDILLIPNSFARSALRRTVDTAIQAVTGIAIYRSW